MPTVCVFLTFDIEIEGIARGVAEIFAQHIAKQDAHRVVNIDSMVLPVIDGAHHVDVLQEAFAQIPPEAAEKRLVIACFADGMAEHGREEYKALQHWCKENASLMQVVNGKNSHHNFALWQEGEQSHLLQTIMGKLDGVKKERRRTESGEHSDDDAPKEHTTEQKPLSRRKREAEQPEVEDDGNEVPTLICSLDPH
eukprot:TRINITY_DN4371_c0_g1_i1.p1 TRINITY_DN4371_c0_g1~~TRINITY_DN4371_c0_g1_i1.p1  ORF type:complete len:196 (+),score=37.73 TRINITY_DN4371_c0_g1_i1:173-760(+)